MPRLDHQHSGPAMNGKNHAGNKSHHEHDQHATPVKRKQGGGTSEPQDDHSEEEKSCCCRCWSFRKFLLTIVALYYLYLLAHHSLAMAVFGVACFSSDFETPAKSADAVDQVTAFAPLWDAVAVSKALRDATSRMVGGFLPRIIGGTT